MPYRTPTCVVVIGGDPVPVGVTRQFAPDVVVVAVDSGYDHARALGWHPVRLVGDLDSISPAGLAHATDHGVVIERHPADKEATDTELGIATAAALGHEHIAVVSGGGGRLDHLLGSVMALGSAPPGVRVDAWIGTARVTILRGADLVGLRLPVGAVVSLLPLGGSAVGVSTGGLRWPLDAETLQWSSTRGISNEVSSPHVTVAITAGSLAVVVPHALGGVS